MGSYNIIKSLIIIPKCMVLMLYFVGHLVVSAKVYNRYNFPSDFTFGAATSSYQVEGAAYKDGRKASIFDAFAHASGRKGNCDTASGEYYKYKEDVQLMADTGLDAYRFSISWSRLIPDGRGPANPKGVEYYNNLIDELVSHGIQPHVTLIHLDVPIALEDKYGGFLSQNIVEDFTAYAEVCFREFGDRVQHWTTVNQANAFMRGGYDAGNVPPGRCSFPFGAGKCSHGNSTTEPYIAAHNILLSHASASRLYKEKYQEKQHGSIGFSLYASHFIPYSNSTEDKLATQRSYDFFIGWFMHPLVHGDYPEIMKTNVCKRMPNFTKNQSKLVKGSFDFIGLNYYTVILVKDTGLMAEPRDYTHDTGSTWIFFNDSSPQSGNPFPVLPWGLQGILEYLKNVYNNPPIYIQENGQMTPRDTFVNDPSRVEYHQGIIGGLLDAVRNGSNAKGYFVWSFIDLYELNYGDEQNFGLYYVDFNDPNLSRYPKLSQRWYSGFLKGKNVTTTEEVNKVDDFQSILKFHFETEEVIYL
ncbi:hypothetical protein vseg_010496 [Gypsophila vaccaria]